VEAAIPRVVADVLLGAGRVVVPHGTDEVVGVAVSVGVDKENHGIAGIDLGLELGPCGLDVPGPVLGLDRGTIGPVHQLGIGLHAIADAVGCEDRGRGVGPAIRQAIDAPRGMLEVGHAVAGVGAPECRLVIQDARAGVDGERVVVVVGGVRDHVVDRGALTPRTTRDQITPPVGVPVPDHHARGRGAAAVPPEVTRDAGEASAGGWQDKRAARGLDSRDAGRQHGELLLGREPTPGGSRGRR